MQQRSHNRDTNTLSKATTTAASEPTTSTMARSIRVAHCCHHHPNRRGSYGDGSFNEKYASSPVLFSQHQQQTMLATRIQPLARPLTRKVSDESEEDKDFHAFQRRHTASTIASSILKQPSLRSIGEMESFDENEEEDGDNMSLDLGDIANFHKKHSAMPRNLHSSLRSIGVSIRSLPREIELLDEDEDEKATEDYDFSSIPSGDDEYLRATEAPSMMDLQASLRSLEHSDIWFLPREKELVAQEQAKNRQPQRRGHSECQQPTKRVSFVQPCRSDQCMDRSSHSRNNVSQRIWQSWNASAEDLAVLQQDLAEMRRKVVSMEALVATMRSSNQKNQAFCLPSQNRDRPLEQRATVPRAA